MADPRVDEAIEHVDEQVDDDDDGGDGWDGDDWDYEEGYKEEECEEDEPEQVPTSEEEKLAGMFKIFKAFSHAKT
jgi:hypothetical protein